MLPPERSPLYCCARQSPARAAIEHFRSICPIVLTLDALFEAKAQVPARPNHVPMKGRRSSIFTHTRRRKGDFLRSASRSEISPFAKLEMRCGAFT
jgi:hypothetical protein